jgi:hypothetical protein
MSLGGLEICSGESACTVRAATHAWYAASRIVANWVTVISKLTISIACPDLSVSCGVRWIDDAWYQGSPRALLYALGKILDRAAGEQVSSLSPQDF